MKEKIVFFGAGPYVIPVIEALSKNFELVMVVTSEPQGPTISYCQSNKINYVFVKNSSEILKHEAEFKDISVAALAYFGIIVSGEVLKLFPLGIINIHPSLLPAYRGPTPGQAALLNGDKTTGVSIMKIDSKVDHGPTLSQVEEKIEPQDDSETLYARLFKIGANLLVKTIPKYISGELKPKEQDHSRATYTERDLKRESGLIKLDESPNIERLDRMIRAYYPWPGVWFKAKLNGSERIVKLLPNQKIQVEGKSVMSLKDFGNGYPEGKEILDKLHLND